MWKRLTVITILTILSCLPAAAQQPTDRQYEYKLLAASRVSTMEKEMSEAAAAGYGFKEVISGETAFGGSKVVVIVSRPAGATAFGDNEVVAIMRRPKHR